MARPGDRGDQPDLGPNQPYPPAGQPQFPASQYPYHTTSEYPSLDQDLNMPDTYAQPVQQNIASQLQDAAASAARNGEVNAMSVNTNGTASAGMAPPQIPHQTSFSPTGGRTSVDETPDTAEPGGSKRKRSKVSRACDECRRKKVKCDAADLDGSIKTCSNCAKAGLTCEYSRIPMKRGPSKGYIKELSDRVQQVESLQAVLAGQPGYRQSLDGGSMAEPLYSPDDPMSLKRNFSFSDARSPFAASEFQRDRIPSVGGAWGTNSPTSAGFRPRDRGSLAIAPDQPLPPTSYPTSSAPYWTHGASDPPPAKRQKLDSDRLPSVKMESQHVAKYYEAIHPELPLLPDLDATLNILHASDVIFQIFFAVSVELIPAANRPGQNGEQGPDGVDQAISLAFPTCDTVSQFFLTRSKELPTLRSAEENLLFAWSCILLAVHSEYKMRGILGGPEARSTLLKQAWDLTTFLKKGEIDGQHATDGRAPTNTDPETFARLVDRARNLTLIMLKYHALGIAGVEFVRLEQYNIALEDALAMPTNAAFVAAISNNVSQVILEVMNLTQPQNPLNIQIKTIILDQLHGYILSVPGMTRDTPLCRQVAHFFDLVLSRYQHVPLAAYVLGPAAQLAEELAQAAEPASSGSAPMTYKPLDIHMFTLTTITLLEVLAAVPDGGLLAIAEQALNTIQPVIERKVEMYRNCRSGLEKAEKWFEGDEEDGGGEGMSWMEVLLRHILERRKVGWATTANGGTGAGGGARGGEKVSVAFDLLLRTGYLNVLSNLA